MKNINGGFSEEVTKSYQWRIYVGDGKHIGGYIGSRSRTIKRDIIVEEILSAQGLGCEGIACWLTSTSGRYLMDDIPKTDKEFRDRVYEYTKNAFLDVTVWSHPDHNGSLGRSLELKNKLITICKNHKK